MRTITQPVTADTELREAQPTVNYASKVALGLDGTAASRRRALLFYAMPLLDAGTDVVSAIAKHYLKGAWAGGPHTVSLQLITATWREDTATWNVAPAVHATIVNAAITGGADGAELTIDFTTALNAALNAGNEVLGYRLALDTNGIKQLHSSESINTELRPVVEIGMSSVPPVARNLRPAEGRKVSRAKGVHTWQPIDQAESRVIVATNNAIDATGKLTTGIVFDSGWVVNPEGLVDLSLVPDATWAGLADGADAFWQLNYRNTEGLEAGWATPAAFGRRSKGALTIDSPVSFVAPAFARTSVAYDRLTGAEVAAGIPRYEPDQFGGRAILVEEGTTNLRLRHDLMDAAAAAGGGVAVTTVATPILNWQAERRRIARTGSDIWGYAEWGIAATVAGEHSVQAIIDNDNLAEGERSRLLFIEVTSVPQRFVYFEVIWGADGKPSASAVGHVSWASPTKFGWKDLGGGLIHVWLVTPADVDPTKTPRVRFDPCKTVGAVVDKAIFTGVVQVEQKPWPTSVVKTTGAAAARAAETLPVPTGGVLSPTEGTVDIPVYVDENFRTKGIQRRLFSVARANAAATALTLYATSGNNLTIFSSNDAGAFSSTFYALANIAVGWHVFTIRWSATRLSLVVDQVERAFIVNPSLASGFAANAYVGSHFSGAEQGNVLHDQFRPASKYRTDAEIAAYDLTKPLPRDRWTTYLQPFDGALVENPGIINTTTPTILSTLTGRAQQSIEHVLERDDVILWESGLTADAKASAAQASRVIEEGLIATPGEELEIAVRTYDDQDREAVPDDLAYVEARRAFVFGYGTGGPTAVSTLVATPRAHGPAVDLVWTRAAGTPDFFALVVDGVIIEDRLVPAELKPNGSEWRYTYYGAIPAKPTTYEIQAITIASGLKHSQGNPAVTAATGSSPLKGIWIVCPSLALEVKVRTRQTPQMKVRKRVGVHDIVGTRELVHITDIVGGYVGQITGKIATGEGVTAADYVARLLKIDGQRGTREVRLAFAGFNFPVDLGEIEPPPSGDLPESIYEVSIPFSQSGEWTFDVVP